MKKIIRLTESDLVRIVKKVLKEQEDIVGGGSANVNVGSTLSNGLKILGLKKQVSSNGTTVFIKTEETGGGQNFSCKAHEAGKYILSPGKIITKEESQTLYNQYCK